MRIVIASSMYPPIRSGSSHYAERIAKGLVKRGHEIMILTSSLVRESSSADVIYANLPSVYLPRTSITLGYKLPYCFFPFTQPIANKQLQKFNPDLIHANGHFMDASLLAASFAKKSRIPIVLTVHTRFMHPNQMVNYFMRIFDCKILRRMWEASDAFIALDKQMKMYILKSLTTDSSRIYPIPLGIDIDYLLKFSQAKSLGFCGLDNRRYILSLSHVTNLKRVDTVLRAFSRIHEKYDDILLVLAGKMCDSHPIDLAKELGILSKVRFLGEVPFEYIPSLISNSLLEMHSLDHRTGLDNASLEAMSLGKPVISCVSEDNFIHHWLRNNENVLLVRPGDVEMTVAHIDSLLSDSRYYDRISKGAIATAREKFSIHRLLDDLENLYMAIA